MAAEQNRCAEMQRLLGRSSLKIAFRQAGAQSLVGDVSTGVFCPIVPAKFRKNISLHLHNISHPGRLAFQGLVSSMFVWRGISNHITNWARSCLHCQQGKIHCHTHLLPQPIPIPQRQFAHLHIDLVGPLQYSNGCNHVFTIIVCPSKWMEAIPFSETSAAFPQLRQFLVLQLFSQMNFCKEMIFLLTPFKFFFFIFGSSCVFFAQAQFESPC
jgi:hypothetical protein